MNSMQLAGGLLVTGLIAPLLLFLLLAVMRSKRAAGGTFSEIDFVLHGASLIYDGYGYYPDWSAMMLREFDDQVAPYLERWFEVANVVVAHPRENWRQVAELEMSGSSKQE